jgi:hypothetical protein
LVLDDGRAVGQRDSLFHKLFHSWSGFPADLFVCVATHVGKGIK